MRKATYSLKKVVCKNSSCIGHSSNVAKPGYWITWQNTPTGTHEGVGRVLGRIDNASWDGVPVIGHLAVIRLFADMTFAGIAWVHPDDVTSVHEQAPAQLLAWITGDEWVKNKHDIARIVAMSQHGTLSEQFIANRDKPEQAYNARPEYVAQFVL